MDKAQIISYIKSNPTVGRTQISKMFGITEAYARHLCKLAKDSMEVEQSDVSERDVAVFLSKRGLSINSVIDLLTPKRKHIENIGNRDLNEFAVGIIGDTHLCDNSCAVSQLHDFYDKCDSAGVKYIVHAGDFVTGENVYKGQTYDLTAHGFTAQMDYAILNYPKIDGITTYAISGNHDLSFKTSAGADILDMISDRRADIVSLGNYDANIYINGVSFGLHHGDAGIGYAASYKLQKAIEAIGFKPQIYVLGHYHQMLYMFYRNVHAFLPGCFQFKNDFSVRKNLPNTVSGIICHLKVDDDERRTIRSIRPEIISYYD